MHPFSEYVNPELGHLLEQVNMDKRFVRGEGCWLYDEAGNRYLDFVAAYGALPFGFNPPEIWAALHEVEANAEPSLTQPSTLEAAGALAKRLIELAPPPLRYVTFANSGAEAVEAAIKAARAATGRLGILTTENSFHGKTLGALSATGRTSYQKAFGAPVAHFERVPYGDAAAVAHVLEQRANEFAAVILEPIQGEGGIVIPPPGYLRAVRDLCTQHDVLLIFDEIQTGLGRTGDLFACTWEGVSPDIMVLAKALGGGLLPIGAMLASAAAYTKEFGVKHSSTFAGNTLACRVGLRSLALLTRDDGELLARVRENGAYLKAGLERIQRRYPQVLTAVRGRGYMLGLEFATDRNMYGRRSLLGPMAKQESLTPVVSSYFLNVERIRVAPTLNGASVIRLEPPLVATRDMCDMVIAAVERTVGHLAAGNTAEIIGHLLGLEGGAAVPPPVTVAEPVRPSNDPAEGRFAFIIHPVNIRNYAEFDETLAAFTDEQLLDLALRWNDLVEPFVAGRTRIVGADGKTAYGEFICIPRTADEFLAMPSPQAVGAIRKAVELAAQRGARIVGLGAYTAVVTRGGLRLKNGPVPITTGNSYTVVSAVDAIYRAVTALGTELPAATIAVMGATGAIGRATAVLLSGDVGRLVLIGNPEHPERARRRLLKVGADIVRYLAALERDGQEYTVGTIGHALQQIGLPATEQMEAAVQAAVAGLEVAGHLVITTDADAHLPQADVVVSATSSIVELVTPAHLKLGAVVCDLSRPPNVSRAVKDARPDVLVIDGGVVEVPGRPDLGWDFGFEQGLAYACMAETMMLALDHHYEDTSLGTDLNETFIAELRQAGERLGFSLAQFRSFDRPLSDEDWQRILTARQQLSVAR